MKFSIYLNRSVFVIGTKTRMQIRRMIYIVDFASLFYKGCSFRDILFGCSAHRQEVYFKRGKLAPTGCKLFAFRKEPFSGRLQNNFDRVTSAKGVSTPLNMGPVVQSVVSLTSSLMVIPLTVLADSIYNILIFFAEKM